MGSTNKHADGDLRSNNSRDYREAKKELAYRLGDWFRRGSLGNARHVSAWIVDCVIEGIERDMAREMTDSARRRQARPSLWATPRPPLGEDLDGYILDSQWEG